MSKKCVIGKGDPNDIEEMFFLGQEDSTSVFMNKEHAMNHLEECGLTVEDDVKFYRFRDFRDNDELIEIDGTEEDDEEDAEELEEAKREVLGELLEKMRLN